MVKTLSPKTQITLFSFIVVVLNILYNQTLPLYVDEAYYWLWSERLQLSYYDHPPMVAYMNYIFGLLFGDTLFAIRSMSIFSLMVSGIYLYKLALEIFSSQEVAAFSLFLYLITPIVQLGMSISTIDSPLVMFWAMALFYSYRALKDESWSMYLLAGVFIGLAMLSKYTAVLLYGSIFLYLIFTTPKKLLTLKPWVAIVVSIIVFSPVIIWNIQNDFISFGYQYAHGTSSEFEIRWDKFFEFLGGQAVVIGPLFFFMTIFMLYKKKEWFRDRDKLFLLINFLFPLLFFLYKGLFKKMELNWAAPAYITLMPLLAFFILHYRYKKITIAGVALSLVLVVVMKYPTLLPLDEKKNFHNRLYGPAEATEVVKKHIREGDSIFSDHLGLASVLSFYLEGHPRVYIPVKTKVSEFTRWDRDVDFSKLHGLHLDNGNAEAELKTIFKHVELVETIELDKKGFEPKTYYLFRVSN